MVKIWVEISMQACARIALAAAVKAGAWLHPKALQVNA
jgi:hypothetical protein